MADPSTLLPALGTRFLGRKVVFREETPSTMELAWDEAERGATEGTLVLAESQTAGRGRYGRSWVTPPGTSLAFSLVLYPPLSVLPRLAPLAGLAAARAIETSTPLRPALKWPNDVLIRGKKVCGILVESRVQGSRAVAVVGVGLNVNFDPARYPEIAAIATSLAAELGHQVPRAAVLSAFLKEFEALYIRADAPDALREWRSRLDTLGKRVRVSGSGEPVEGLAEDVDGDGALLLRSDDGVLRRFLSGEVTLGSLVQPWPA